MFQGVCKRCACLKVSKHDTPLAVHLWVMSHPVDSGSSTMAGAHTVTTLAGVKMPAILYGTAWKKERTTDLVVQACSQPCGT